MTERVWNEWRNRVAAEYRSGAITAQTLHWLIQVGMGDEMVNTALRIVRDELDHAALSHRALVALGGDDGPAPLQLGDLALPAGDNVFASLIDSIVVNFCLGETFAVPLFNAMYKHTTHPVAREVLTRVLQDEAVHRGFGWDSLDVLLEIDGDGVRTRIEHHLDAWIGAFEQAYAMRPEVPDLTEDERAAGLMDVDVYADVFWETLLGDIRSRFGRRGIDLPDRWLVDPPTDAL